MDYKGIHTKLGISGLIICFIVGASLIVPELNDDSEFEEIRLFKLMESLGYDSVDHFPDTDVFGVSANRGKEIVTKGFSSRPGGGRTKKQSKHFVCTSCHNIVREDPDLSNPNPQDRLIYSEEQGIPFLQGTSLYGAVNRERYYNDDYYKKYGDLVIAARDCSMCILFLLHGIHVKLVIIPDRSVASSFIVISKVHVTSWAHTHHLSKFGAPVFKAITNIILLS